MAAHYGAAVIPARPYKPRDKAKVEVGVQVVQRWILARLRNRRFFSLAELNQAIRELVGKLNDRPMVAATRAFGVDAAQSGWASALMNALIAGRLPGADSKLVRQTIETTTAVRPGDVMTIVAKVMSKAPEGRRVTIGVRATNQHGDLAMSGTAEIVAPNKAIVAEPREEFVQEMHEKGRRYKQLIEVTRNMKLLKTAVVHPVDEASLMGAVEAACEDLIEPVLVGPERKIRQAAAAHNIDIDGYQIVSTEHSHAAAAKAVAMARSGEVEALMKGALHTDELMHEVVATDTGLRTSRRISHVFAIDAPAYPRPLFITDAAVNIFPDLTDKRDILQNAIDLVTGELLKYRNGLLNGLKLPRREAARKIGNAHWRVSVSLRRLSQRERNQSNGQAGCHIAARRARDVCALRILAAATASRHVVIAAARSTRCDLADVRWRWTLKVL